MDIRIYLVTFDVQILQMEFFELGIDRIHKLIFSCFSLAAEKGLLFGVSALLFGILIVLIGKRFRLFKRESKWRQIIARTYYFYIPFIFFAGGFAFGAAVATQEFFAAETKTSISPLMKLIFPAYQSHVNTHWDRVIQTRMSFYQTVDEYVKNIKFVKRNDGFSEKVGTYTANFMVPKITKWGVESVVSSARNIAIRQSEEKGYIETSKVKALLIVHSLSMFNYPPGLWDEANASLEGKAIFFFKGVGGNILLVFLFLFLLPLSETVLFFVSSRKRNKSGRFHSGQSANTGDITTQGKEMTPTMGKPAQDEVPKVVDIEIPKLFDN